MAEAMHAASPAATSSTAAPSCGKEQRASRRRKAASEPLSAESQAAAVAETDGALLASLVATLELGAPAFLARGQRGVVFVAGYATRGAGGFARDVCVKLPRTKRARTGEEDGGGGGGGAGREAAWLERCNAFGVGPKLLAADGGAVAMEFARGETIGGALERADAARGPALAASLRDLLGQCRRLDAHGIDKREMHRCARHVVVPPDGAPCTLLDFERCAESAKPQNVTGIAQYLSQSWAASRLAAAGIVVDVPAVRAASKRYKDDASDAALASLEAALGFSASSTAPE